MGFIDQHPLALIAAYWLFSAIVGGMPAPVAPSSIAYEWAFHSLNIMSGNLGSLVPTRYRPSPEAPEAPVNIHACSEGDSTMDTTAPKLTFLQHFGNFIRKILNIGIELAVVAEPEVDLAFPEVAPIYNTTIGLVVAAEATAVSATGTGEQKLAQVTATLVPQVQAWATKNGIVWNEAEITKWASAIVDTLNMIPAPTKTPVLAPVL